MNSTVRFTVTCVLGIGLGGCATQTPGLAKSREYLRQANYYQAYQVLLDAVRQFPDDPTLRRELEAVRVGYLLEQGQELVFRDRDGEAISAFEEVLQLRPDNATAREWIAKARFKLAERATLHGDEYRSVNALDKALLAYKDARTHVPDHAPAIAGVKFVAETWAKRRAGAEASYAKAVDAIGEELLPEAWYHLSNALLKNPEHERAQDRSPSIERQLNLERYAKAIDLEQAGFYGAALKEYEKLKSLDYLDGIGERLAAMTREVEAEKLVRRGEMAAFRDEFGPARELLEKAFDMSKRERSEINSLLVLLRERELATRYTAARFLELEHKYETALAEFRAIDEAWPDGFRDVKTRISTLETTLEIADKAYKAGQEAEAAGKLKAAIEAYEEVLLIAPGYKDLAPKVAELKARAQG